MIAPGVLLAALLATAGSEEKIKIAVPETRISGIQGDIGRMLNEVIAAETSQLTKLSVITPSDIKAMIGFEEQRQMLGCDQDLGCMAEIGGALGVNLLVVSDLAKFGESHVLNVKLVDIKKVEVIARVYKVVEGEVTEVLGVVRESMPKVLASVTPVEEIRATEVGAGSNAVTAAEPAPAVETDFLTAVLTSDWTKWGVIGLGGAMLITAGSLQLVAMGEHSDATASLELDDGSLHAIDATERLERAESYSQAALGLAIAGGVVAAAGVTWLLFPDLIPIPVSATPVVTGDTVGFAVSGGF